MRPTRRVGALLGVLLLHGFGALTWVASLGFGADIGTERQFHQGLAFGVVTWLVAALVIVWVWRSGNSTVAIPFAWWLPSFLLMVAIVYGW
jgi:diacylglycerol kinase family enzyme